jgi:hypothetical protein
MASWLDEERVRGSALDPILDLIRYKLGAVVALDDSRMTPDLGVGA